MRSRFHLPGIALLVLFVAGCGESLTGGVVPASAPETEVTATPPVLSETDYTVSFFWTGFDPDGSIVGYEWRISDNGEDGIVDVGDTLSTQLPWIFTDGTDSTFIVSADIEGFDKDVDAGLSEKSTRFWQTHTFFVRSVDNDGHVDPTPANVSFTATTLAPTVQINLPAKAQPTDCSQAPPAISFGWDATDPDNQEKTPRDVRYLLKKFGNITDPCLLKGEFEAGEFPITSDDVGWSDWVRYDAGLDSGKIVRYPALPASDLGTSYVFVVQARDVAGAVTPLFEWGRNVRHVRVSDTKSPFLSVTERFLGTDSFQKTNSAKRFTIASKQVVEFEWFADASSYGNLVEGYRYGFSLVDPNDPDDPNWVVPWGDGPNWRRSAPRTFAQGSPNFIVQARDSSNQISRGTYLFQVVQVARRSEQRRLLLVDDHPKAAGVDNSERIDALWDQAWRKLIQGIGVQGFQSADVIDAVDDNVRLSFPLVNDYRGVIWFMGPGDSYFHTRLAPANRVAPRFNWLEVYQSFVGNVLFVGSGSMVGALERYDGDYPIALAAPGGPGSLGSVEATGGESVAAGTLRYPYTAWCLDAVDQVRPPNQSIFGEQAGGLVRGTKCSALVYAGPTSEFYMAFEVDQNLIPALRPTDIREFGSLKYGSQPGQIDPTELNTLKLKNEEFYNSNVTSMPVTINVRDCQVPMYRMLARRDVDEQVIFDSTLASEWSQAGLEIMPAIVDSIFVPEVDPDNYVDNCESQLNPRVRRSTSVTSLKTIAVASGVFVGLGPEPPSKQDGTLLSWDFLWGFNPIHFREAGVRTALRWMIIDHWGVNTDF